MPRPFNRAQALQNAAFLDLLARTGNAREAARTLGLHRATLTKRRARDAAFAAEWDAALAVAHARFNAPRAPGLPADPSDAAHPPAHVVRRANGRLQLRRATTARRLTRAHEQAFLAALSASANVRLSAAAAGFSHSAFYVRRRSSPAFAREMRLALEMGYERLELALIEGFAPDSYRDDAWRHNDPPAIAPMTANQALQLLYLHQKEVRLEADPPHIRRRRGESKEAHSARLSAIYCARQQRSRDDFLIGETEYRARHGRPSGLGPSLLPDLSQVTGWSKADPDKTPYHDDVALFGGWRLGDVKARQDEEKGER